MKPETAFIQNSTDLLNEPQICQNCGEHVSGQFCLACGQKYPQPRMTLKALFMLAYESVIDFDRGFLFTVKGLFVHPQQVIHDYWIGKRIIYTNPIKYLLIWLGLSTFIGFSILDVDTFTQQVTQQMQLQQTGKPAHKLSAEQKRMMQQTNYVQQLTMQNPQFMYVVLVPLLSVCSMWMFRKKGYTYAEHLLMDTYLMGQTTLITIPMYGLFVIFCNHLTLVAAGSSVLAAGYYAFVTMGVFKGKVRAWLKGLFAYLLAYLIFMILAGVAGGIYAILTISK